MYGLLAYLSIPSEALFPPVVAASLSISSIGIVLLCCGSAEAKRLGCRCLCIVVGALLGLVSLIGRDQELAFVGLPLESITTYEVQTSDDTLHTALDDLLVRGRLTSVSSSDGSSASATGSVLLVGCEVALDWGTHARIYGSLQAAGGPGADWIGRVEDVEVHGRGWHFELRRRVRGWVSQRLHLLGRDEAALFMALFLGAREDLADSESYFFRRAGAIHLLALSGFHLGILSFILVGVLSPLIGRTRAILVTAVCLGIYLFVAGPKVSLLRAVLMFGVLGCCRLAGCRARGIDLLSLTFLMNALLWPASLFTLSFQLSYIALAGIMLLGPIIDRFTVSFLPKLIRIPAAAAIGAQIVTSPLLVARFGLLYPVGLLSGLVLTPLVTAFMWGGLAIVLLPLPARIGYVCADGMTLIHHLLLGNAEFFARANPVRFKNWEFTVFITLVVLILSRLPTIYAYVHLMRRTNDSSKCM